MTVRSIDFVKSATEVSGYPADDLVDVVVCGRSNVGKSSLINCLFERKRLAHTSSTPGRTRLINFFRVSELFYLVDLPGFGFAKRSKGERRSWQVMIEQYLERRHRLVSALVLIDVRRGPEEEEFSLFELFGRRGMATIAVLTKADKLAKSQKKLRAAELERALSGKANQVVLFSSKTGAGREQLWQALLNSIPSGLFQ